MRSQDYRRGKISQPWETQMVQKQHQQKKKQTH